MPFRLKTFLALTLGLAPLAARAEVRIDAAPQALTLTPAKPVPGDTVTLHYVNADTRGQDAYAHFGFNGWNLALAGADAGRKGAAGENVDHFFHKKMRYDAARGRYELSFVLPAGAKAMHFAFCWAECQVGQWDNRRERDYGWPVAFPYIGPYLTWNEETKPHEGAVIQLEHQLDEAVTLTYWREGGSRQTKVVTTGPMRRFVLTGLLPDTQYKYKLTTPAGFTSAEYAFTTFPAAPGSVSFLLFGDAQDDGETGRFREVATAMDRDQPDTRLILATGDMPWNDMPGHWWYFFDRAKDLFARRVLMPVLGNHDTPGNDSHDNHSSFVYYFALPGIAEDHAFYRFDVGPAAFLGMNSERRREFSPGERQYEWLKARLSERHAEAQRAQRAGEGALWTFVYWHHPPYNAGARHWTQQFETRPLTRLFDGLVDWGFSGHEHFGQRFKPLRWGGERPRVMGTYGTAADQGVGYAVVPGGGAIPAGTLLDRDDAYGIRGQLAFPAAGTPMEEPWGGYARIDLAGGVMDYRTFKVAPGQLRSVVMDRVRYLKPSGSSP